MHKKRVLIALILIFSVICIITQNVYADDDNFSTTAFENQTTDASSAATSIMAIGINVIRIVGTGVSIIMLTYIGIKYMMSSPEEKGEYKKTMTAFVVGAVLVFASTNILYIIANFANSNISSASG